MILKLLGITLILSACANSVVSTEFDGKWQFLRAQGDTWKLYDIDQSNQPILVPPVEDSKRLCLKKEETLKLRELLIRCKGSAKSEP